MIWNGKWLKVIMLVLVGDDGITVKSMNVDGQDSTIDHFLCFSDTFGTPNTTIKADAASANDTPSNNGEDGSIKRIKSNKLNSMRHVSYANHLNGEPSKKVPNFRTLISPVVAYAVVENYVKNAWSRFSLVRTMMNSKGNVPLILRKWSPLAYIAKEDLKSGRSSFAGAITDIHVDVELKDTLVAVVTKIKGNGYVFHFELSISGNQNKMFNFSRSVVDVASSSGTKIVTSNPFDALNMVDKDIGVTLSGSDDVEEDDNEIVSFMASKSSYGKGSSISRGGTGSRVYMSAEKMTMMITLMRMMRNVKTYKKIILLSMMLLILVLVVKLDVR
ncbi:hypothetical protein Tco_0550448 [Tanacetum coccineum]